MDNKKNGVKIQQNETPVPIFETVPVENSRINDEGKSESLIPEEVSPDASAPDQSVSNAYTPEIQPIDEPVVYREQSKLPLIIGLMLFFICIFGVIFFMLIGKSGGGLSQPKALPKIELQYWGLWEEKEVMEPLIREYQKKNPHINIVYERKDHVDYRQKVLTRSKNGTGPDIFRFHNTWLPEIQEIVVAAPEKVINQDEFKTTFYPIHVKDLILGSKIYGIPLMIDGLVLICNDDLLRKAGIVSAPSSWDDLVQNAGKVMVKGKEGNVITAGLAGGLATNVEHFSDLFGLMLLLNGGEINKLGSVEAVGALEAFRRFAEPPNNVWNEDQSNSISSFIEGKVAMVFAPSWQVLGIKAAAPSLRVTVVPIPQLPGGKQLSMASYWAEGVSRYSKNQEEAWKFLQFLSSKDAQTKMFELQSTLRLFGTAYSRKDLGSLLIQHEYLGAVIKQAQQDQFVSLPLISRTFDQGLNDEIIRYLENAITATTQGVSYSEALSIAAQGVDQILQRYKIE